MVKPTFYMSQAGYCPRRLTAQITRNPGVLQAPPWLKLAAEEGRVHEWLIKEDLRYNGCAVKGEEELKVLETENFILRGKIDGRVQLTPDMLRDDRYEIHSDFDIREFDFDLFYPLEIKSMSFFEYQRWRKGAFDEFPHYAMQLACYVEEEPHKVVIYIVKDRSGGTRQLHLLKNLPASFNEVEQNLNRACVEGLAEAEYDPYSMQCKRCEARRLCKPDAPEVDDSEMEDLLRNFYLVHSNIKTLEDSEKVTKLRIIQFLKDNKLPKFKAGRYYAALSSFPRETISIKGLQGLGMIRDDFEGAIKTTDVDRLTVMNLEEDFK